MDDERRASLLRRLRKVLVGGAKDPLDHSVFHKLSLIAFFAWVGLGADGLSSSCYGPPEAWITLGGHRHLGLFVGLATAVTVLIISASYSQIVELFPSGGGGYLVASKLLSPRLGMVAGCALLIDYVLTIAVSIASGAEAIFSLLPVNWYHSRIFLAAGGVILLTLLNLRGVKESVVPLVPIFLLFVVSHAFAILYSLLAHAGSVPQMVGDTVRDVSAASRELGFFGMLLLILRAYSMGAGTFTGIEAVSNGMPVLREPRVHTAKRTMAYMAFSLAFMALGLMVAYVLCNVRPQVGKTINAVLFQNLTAGWNQSTAFIFSLLTLVSEGAILFVGAQAGFVDGPRVISNMAMDRWLPTRFGVLSDRLVAQNGILFMGGAALALVLLTNGNVAYLVVLYSINVFITFCLSQLGMVRHWWAERKGDARWKHKLLINGLGLGLSAFILVSVSAIKFHEGGWITLLVTGSLVGGALAVRAHYTRTSQLLRRLDELVSVTESPGGTTLTAAQANDVKYDPDSQTAIILVNGFNGIGLHTLFGAMRLFGGSFRNFVFVQIGVIDAGNFKGKEALDQLREHIPIEIDRYVQFVRRNGYYGEALWAVGVDILEEADRLVPIIQQRFPRCVFFGGQLVFPTETFMNRWLHNYLAFALQRRFYRQGIPFVILPIRV